MKNDITKQSDRELSLIVFNDEGLYNMRRNPSFFEVLETLFIFTNDQLNVLKEDLRAEEESQ